MIQKQKNTSMLYMYWTINRFNIGMINIPIKFQSVTPVNTSYNSWMSTSTPGSGVAGTPGSGVPGTPGSAGQSGGHSPLNTSSNLRRDHFAGKMLYTIF